MAKGNKSSKITTGFYITAGANFLASVIFAVATILISDPDLRLGFGLASGAMLLAGIGMLFFMKYFRKKFPDF